MFLTETTTAPKINWQDLLNTIINWCLNTGVKLVIGLVLMIILFKIINILTKKLYKRLKAKNVDETLLRTITSAIRVIVKGLIVLCFVGYVGIETASITALITSCGVALGLALQGSLSNLAGGIIIILMRPFRIGDYIEAQGEGGTVEDIQIFYTYIVTPDNKVIMIPNGSLANGNIRNYSTKEFRRVDFEFSISYDEDFERAKKVIWEVIENTEFVLMDPQPFVRVKTHGESTINIVTRVWTKNEHYWDVYFDMMESIKTNFDKSNIEIPYNQLDVHIKEK